MESNEKAAFQYLETSINDLILKLISVLAQAAKQTVEKKTCSVILNVTSEFGVHAKNFKSTFKDYRQSGKNLSQLANAMKIVNAEASNLPKLLESSLNTEQMQDLEDQLILLSGAIFHLSNLIRNEMNKSNQTNSNSTSIWSSTKSNTSISNSAKPANTTPSSTPSNSTTPSPTISTKLNTIGPSSTPSNSTPSNSISSSSNNSNLTKTSSNNSSSLKSSTNLIRLGPGSNKTSKETKPNGSFQSQKKPTTPSAPPPVPRQPPPISLIQQVLSPTSNPLSLSTGSQSSKPSLPENSTTAKLKSQNPQKSLSSTNLLRSSSAPPRRIEDDSSLALSSSSQLSSSNVSSAPSSPAISSHLPSPAPSPSTPTHLPKAPSLSNPPKVNRGPLPSIPSQLSKKSPISSTQSDVLPKIVPMQLETNQTLISPAPTQILPSPSAQSSVPKKDSPYEAIPLFEGKRSSVRQSKVAAEAINLLDPNYSPNYKHLSDEYAIPISKLPSHIDKLNQLQNGKPKYSQEFEEIEEVTIQTMMNDNYSSSFANMYKNRYGNVLAPESTRVTLTEIPMKLGSDYINANWITGLVPNSKTAYIATQGPLDDTISDFWRMIWETNCSVIIMLARELEKESIKCAHYWPETEFFVQVADDLNESGVSTLQVRAIKEITISQDIVQRDFQLNHIRSGQQREVTQYHYVSWPDLGIPSNTEPFLELIGLANRSNTTKGPLTIHCSAGVGRTGSFIAFHCILEKILYDKRKQPNSDPIIDVSKTIVALRSQRPGMVQTEDQYLFIWMAIKDAVRILVSN